MATSDERAGSRPAKLWRFIRRYATTIVEFVTAAAGLTVFVLDFFVQLELNEQLPTIIVALLALLATSALLERVTKLDDVDRKLDVVHSFIAGGEFDRKIERVSESASASLRRFRAAGMRWTYRNLDEAKLGDALKGVKAIRILATWTGISTMLSAILPDLARSGCVIHILLLQHTSDYARLRSRELGHDDAEYAPGRIVNELNEFNWMIGNDPVIRQRLTVKAYDGSPVVYLIAYDSTRLLGLFWRNRMTIQTPLLELVGARDDDPGTDRRSDVVKLIDSHFDDMWNDPRTKYVKLVGREPRYVATSEEVWS